MSPAHLGIGFRKLPLCGGLFACAIAVTPCLAAPAPTGVSAELTFAHPLTDGTHDDLASFRLTTPDFNEGSAGVLVMGGVTPVSTSGNLIKYVFDPMTEACLPMEEQPSFSACQMVGAPVEGITGSFTFDTGMVLSGILPQVDITVQDLSLGGPLFDFGGSVTFIQGTNSGTGFIRAENVNVPEPTSLTLIGTALALLVLGCQPRFIQRQRQS